MNALLTFDGIIALITLVVMEVVLGIDNIIFISIFSNKLPGNQRPKARFIGLMLALVFRTIMLLSITWIISMKQPIINLNLSSLNIQDVTALTLSIRDLILLAGGIFLIIKTTKEIGAKVDLSEDKPITTKKMSLSYVVFQIALIDIVFSFDSILTAIGLVDEVIIMIIAVAISMLIMILFSKHVAEFIDRHPTVKMLALAFLIMIGIMLVAEAFSESFHFHFPKGYIYFGMAFSFFVELLNMRTRKKSSETN